MDYRYECYRRPYRRGDYDLVDTTRAGTYWRSPEGVVVQLASAAGEAADFAPLTRGTRLATIRAWTPSS